MNAKGLSSVAFSANTTREISHDLEVLNSRAPHLRTRKWQVSLIVQEFLGRLIEVNKAQALQENMDQQDFSRSCQSKVAQQEMPHRSKFNEAFGKEGKRVHWIQIIQTDGKTNR